MLKSACPAVRICFKPLIRVDPRSSVSKKVRSFEFGVKADKLLLLTLSTLGTRNFRHFLICVHLHLSVSHWVFIVLLKGRFANRPYVFLPEGSAMALRIRSGVMGSSNSLT